MATYSRGALTIGTVATAASTGKTLNLRQRPTGKTYTMQVVFNAFSTQAKVRMQGSIDGVTWNNIGAAVATVKSSATYVSVSTAHVYDFVRAVMSSRSTKAGGAPAVSVYVVGA